MATDETRMDVEVTAAIGAIDKLLREYDKVDARITKILSTTVSYNKQGEMEVKVTAQLADANKTLSFTFDQLTGKVVDGTSKTTHNSKAKQENASASSQAASANNQLAESIGSLAPKVENLNKDMLSLAASQQSVATSASASIGGINAALAPKAKVEDVNRRQDAIMSLNTGAYANNINDLNRAESQNIGITSALVGKQQQLGTTIKDTSEHVKGSVAHISKFANIAVNMAERLVVFDIVGRTFFQISDYVRQSIPNFIQLSKAISEIQTISQQAQLSTGAWQKGIVQLSNAFGNTAADVAEASYQALSNQIVEGASTFTFMNEVLKLSKATVSDAATAQDALASVMNAYGKSVYDAEQISATFFKTVDLGRVRLEDMSNTIGNLIVWGAELGISFEEIAASIDTMTIRGVRYSVASTMLQNMFVKLVKPTKEMSKFYKDLGYSTAEAAVAGETFYGLLGRIDERTKGSSAEIAKYFNTIRGLRGALFSTGAELQATLKALNITQTESLDDYRRAVDITMESTATKYQRALEKVRNYFTTTFGENIVNLILNMDALFNGLDKAVKTLITSFSILGTVIGAGQIAKGVMSFTTGVAAAKAAGLAFATLVGGLPGILVGAIGALTALGSAYFGLSFRTKDAKDKLQEYVKELGKLGQARFEEIKLATQFAQKETERRIKAETSLLLKQNAEYKIRLNERAKETQEIFNRIGRDFANVGKNVIKTMEQEVKTIDSIINKIDTEIKSIESSIENINIKLADNKLRDYFSSLDFSGKFNETKLTKDSDQYRLQIEQQKASVTDYYDKRIVIMQEKIEDVKKQLELGEEELGRWEYDALVDKQKSLETKLAPLMDQKAATLVRLENAAIARQQRNQLAGSRFGESLEKEKIATLFQFANQAEARGIELFDVKNIDAMVQALERAKEAHDPKGMEEASRQIEYQVNKIAEARKSMDKTVEYYDQAAAILKGMADKALQEGNYSQANKYMADYNRTLEARNDVLEDQSEMEIKANEMLQISREQQLRSLQELTTELDKIKTIYDEIKSVFDSHKTSLEGLPDAWRELAKAIAETDKTFENSVMYKFFEQATGMISGVEKDQKSLEGLSTNETSLVNKSENRIKMLNDLTKVQLKYYEAFGDTQSSFISGLSASVKIIDESLKAIKNQELASVAGSELPPGMQGAVIDEVNKNFQKQYGDYFTYMQKLANIKSPMDFINDPSLLDNLTKMTASLMKQEGLSEDLKTSLGGVNDNLGVARDLMDTTVTAAEEMAELNRQDAKAVEVSLNDAKLEVTTKQFLVGVMDQITGKNAQMVTDTQKIAENMQNVGKGSSTFAQALKEMADIVPQLSGKSIDALKQSFDDMGIKTDEITETFRDHLPNSITQNLIPSIQSMYPVLQEVQTYLDNWKATLDSLKTITLPGVPLPQLGGTGLPPAQQGWFDWQNFLSQSIFQAHGGKIPSKGTDTIPAMLSPGEFVVKASQASRYYNLLHSINQGDEQAIINNIFNGVVRPIVPMRYFADGGSVTPNNTYGDFNISVNHQNGDLPFSTVLKIGRALEKEVRKGTIRL